MLILLWTINTGRDASVMCLLPLAHGCVGWKKSAETCCSGDSHNSSHDCCQRRDWFSVETLDEVSTDCF